MRTSDYIDRLNYLNDPRVRAAADPGVFLRFDPRTMTGTVRIYDDAGNETEAELHARYEVCDTCDGRGHHTNPSMDAGGLDTEDMDDEDMESYFDGRYDVACYECNGRRVVPVPVARNAADEAVLDQLRELEDAAELSRAEQRAELAMGA